MGITKSSSGDSPGILEKSLAAQEQKLIEAVRKLDYGEVRVVVKNSVIVQIEEKKSIKL